MKKLLVFGALFLAAFAKPDTVPFPVPKGWPQPVYSFKENPLSANKIALGRRLFFDPVLSRDSSISCASCHLPQTAFTHIDHDLSHGIGDRIGTRNAPALQNLAWSKHFMWDGAVHHLDVQSLNPITNPLEMDETLENAVRKLQNSSYPARYAKAFGDTTITGERTLKAISQFMLTAVSADAKYDRVQRSEAQFNPTEAQGYALFQKNCASCHQEPLFTNGDFENNGLPPDTGLQDEGREKITRRENDRYKFKVPSLRNVEVSYPYMHDGRFKSLQMVLFHYTNGVAHMPNVSPKIGRGLKMNEEEKRALIAFLKTLTDESFLHNPALQPPQTPF